MNRSFPRIRVHFSFLVFTALIFLLRSSSVILSFSAVCAVHEAGHIFAAHLCGKPLAAIELTGFGIRMETDKRCISSAHQDAFILIAGPAVNVIAYFLLGFTGCGGSFRLLSLAAALYNLLPYRQLDGGALIALFTEGTACELTATRLLTAVKLFVSFTLLLLTLYSGAEIAPLFIASLILLICDVK